MAPMTRAMARKKRRGQVYEYDGPNIIYDYVPSEEGCEELEPRWYMKNLPGTPIGNISFRNYEHRIKNSKNYARYCRQINQSQGFDIVDYPGPTTFVLIVPYDYIPDSCKTEERPLVTDLAKIALSTYNEHCKCSYDFVDVEKWNVGLSGVVDVYFITFTVKCPISSEIKIFQARVADCEPPVVGLCRPKPEP